MKISSVRSFLLSYPFREPLKLSFYGGERTIVKRDAMLIRIDTDNLHVLADVRLPHSARPAVPAIHVHFGAHEIARLYRRNFVADFFDRPTKFVAKRHRRTDARCRPAVPSINVQIRAAD